jgi:Ca2+-binding RTX toxin-like protein
MSFLARGDRRVRRSVALVAAGALMTFQALAIVEAPSALAISSCTFSGGTLSIVLSRGESIVLSQNASGVLLVNGANTTAAPCSTTRATVMNTTAISVTGSRGDQDVTVQMDVAGAGTTIVSWGTINWPIDLASGSGDSVTIDGSDLTTDDVDITLGASGIDLNGDDDLDVILAGVEDVFVDGGDRDDTIWAAGSTATGAAFTVNLTARGGDGDDTIASGAGDDDLRGGVAGNLGDMIDFSGATAAVDVDLLGGIATGMGSDVLADFENVAGSAFDDHITGNELSNSLNAREGKDHLRGEGGDDTIRGAGGEDTLRGGSGEDDLLGGAANDGMFGGGGTDFGDGGGGKDVCKGVEMKRSCGT